MAIAQATEVTSTQTGGDRIRFHIYGMTCAGCASRAEKALREVDGVSDASIQLASEGADVTLSRSIAPTLLDAALVKAGFETDLGPNQDVTPGEHEAVLSERETRHLLFSACLTIPLLAPMVSGGQIHLPPIVQFAVTLPILFWLGSRFFKGAYNSLRMKTSNMDVLIALGTSAAFAYSCFMWLGSGVANPPLYFETVAVIITLVLFGKWLEKRAKAGTTKSLTALTALRPDIAHLMTDGQVQDIQAALIAPGDRLLIRPGERIPVDGLILSGQTEIDNAHLTGESLPVSCAIGDKVFGGALNGAGAVEIEATTNAASSLLSKIIDLVETVQSEKAPIQHLVDRITAVFVPVVVAIAVLTTTAWLISGAGAEHAILTGIAVLVIACPCALGLATPTALVAGLGAAARHGIIVRGTRAMEMALHIDTIAFDKTGTLTQGRPELVSLQTHDTSRAELLRLTASLQQKSEHLFAKALVETAASENIPLTIPQNVDVHLGEGISGDVSGQSLIVGRRELLVRLGVVGLPEDDEAYEPGTSPVFASLGGSYLGTLVFADAARATSKEAIASLRSRGIKTAMLTGDRREAAQKIGDELDLKEIHANLSPAEKVAFIRDHSGEGHRIAMVGDGINDAPALAAADLSIAMGSGTDAAIETAQISLMRSDPRLILDAIDICRATHRKIGQNLIWAFSYNTVAVPLAALGYLSPMIAAGAMALSSICVVTNSLLLSRWKAKTGATS